MSLSILLPQALSKSMKLSYTVSSDARTAIGVLDGETAVSVAKIWQHGKGTIKRSTCHPGANDKLPWPQSSPTNTPRRGHDRNRFL